MHALKNCKLFDGFNDTELTEIAEHYITKKRFFKDNFIANEGDICSTIGIVLKGAIALQTLYPSGKVLTHLNMKESDVFGEALLFNQNSHYPIDIRALNDCEIGFITKQNLLIIFADYQQALNNYLMLMSQKLLLLNRKIRNLSLDTIDKRIANFLLQAYGKHGKKMFKTGISRKAMAQMMGVQRPSLSRTLSKMRNDGIIDYDGDSFKIIDFDKLENILS